MSMWVNAGFANLISLFALTFIGLGAVAEVNLSEACGQIFANEIDLRPLRLDEINYKLLGKGHKETIVLIHGLDSAMPTFANIEEKLATHFQVLLYDQRGHGTSSAGGDIFSSTLMAEDLAALLHSLNISKAHILGHSFGARTATAFAGKYPQMVRSLIIEDMELQSRGIPSEKEKRQVLTIARELRNLPVIYENRKELVAQLDPYFAGMQDLSKRRAVELPDGRMQLLFRPHVSYLYGSQANAEDLLPQYRSVRQPILVMIAGQGSAASKKGINLIREAQPDAQINLFKDAGHTIHRGPEQENFEDVLIKFVKSVP